ncbi:MAG TPA: DUF1616 domain-containing protein [Methanocorpusculum sp.]|nr:DUF1616 domain-containing protein [Methanocorpusculum sp.]HKL97400.1 DUF1616 domain-containing protein [Methanocorpusculum sp.]
MPEKDLAATLANMADPKNFPKDLAIILAWLVITIVMIYVPVLNETFLRVIFAVPVILFIPGYVLIAALFPEKRSIDAIERFALSVGLSIAVVPLIGLVLNYTPFGIRLDPIVTALVIFILAMMLVTLFRRALVPEEERFAVPFEQVKPTLKTEFFPKNGSKLDKALSWILIAAILVATVTTAYVIAFPKDGEKFTEFYILGSDKMADNYPEKFFTGTQQFVWVGIGNHEYRDVTYTVETLLLNAEWDSVTNASVIHASKVLDRYSVPVADNSTYLEIYNFTVYDTGYNRLEFLLYNESVPDVGASAEDKMAASYRDLHLWIKVV